MSDTPHAQPRIVVGIDGSPSSASALRWAARLAGAVGARIDAITVWDFTSSYGWSSLPPLSPPHPEIEKDLNGVVDTVFGPDRPVDLTTRVVEGPIAGCLLAAARGAHLIVVGSRGRGPMTGLMLGSVSRRVAEHATCPVLVVHDGDDPPAN